VGAFIISNILSTLVSIAPLIGALPITIESFLDKHMIFSAVGILTVSSLVSGYFGLGPAEVLEPPDEFILMPAPIHPHQIFLSRYTRRIIRKMTFIVIGLFIVIPLLPIDVSAFSSILIFIIALTLFLEVNAFIGGIGNFARNKLDEFTTKRIRHLLLPVMVAFVYVPSLSPFSGNFIIQLIAPANVFSLIIMELSGIYASGIDVIGLTSLIFISFFVAILFIANVCDYTFYERFSGALSNNNQENSFTARIRGEADFSQSRFNDPMMWIILKDFWSKMRSPIQFYKYLYVIIGTIFVIILNVFNLPWIQPFAFPPSLSYSAVLAFLLILILFTQLASVPSLLAFIDEKENIYLIKTSPFREQDVVLAKYIMSLIEVSLTSIPLYGFILYFFRVQGSAFLITLAAPMLIVFCATGIMAGAYVPVFTNNPRNPPVPLAFSFPAINLTLGGIIVWIAATYAEDIAILWILPLFTMVTVLIFLSMSVRALKLYR